jgi:hypothetical protein
MVAAPQQEKRRGLLEAVTTTASRKRLLPLGGFKFLLGVLLLIPLQLDQRATTPIVVGVELLVVVGVLAVGLIKEQ